MSTLRSNSDTIRTKVKGQIAPAVFCLEKKNKKRVDFDHKTVSLDFTFWRLFHFHLRLYIAFDNISFIIFSLLRCISYIHQSFILYQWEEEEEKTKQISICPVSSLVPTLEVPFKNQKSW
jgi:hypothetical protein